MNKYLKPYAMASPVRANIAFSLISYGKLAHDLRVFNLSDVFQERVYRVDQEVTTVPISIRSKSHL
jgi:hypothetical protein